MQHSFVRFFLGLVCLLTVTIGSSCKKDKDPEPTRKELLSHAWKVVDVTTEAGQSVFNLPIPIAEVDCVKDNILTLVSDNSFSFDEGAVRCDPPMEAEGTWSLSANESQLILVSPGEDDVIIDIVSVDGTRFKIKYVLEDGPLPGTYIIVLEHKQ